MAKKKGQLDCRNLFSDELKQEICKALKENEADFLLGQYWDPMNKGAHLDLHNKPYYKALIQSKINNEVSPYKEKLQKLFASAFNGS